MSNSLVIDRSRAGRLQAVIRVALFAAWAAFTPTPLLAGDAPASVQPATEPFEFTAPDGLRFDARIERASGAEPNSWSVMLIGGGSITDIDWTIQPRVNDGGTMREFTLDGTPTKDAESIARELRSRGYTVLRWSSIHKDDPSHAADPAQADYQQFDATADHTRAAFRAFEQRAGFERGKVILVGHSLGAARAAAVIRDENGIAGLVSIAGAELARGGWRNADLRERVKTDLSGMDADASGGASREEFGAWAAKFEGTALAKAGFDALDFDRDGELRDWEIAAGWMMSARMEKELALQQPSLRGDNPFLEDVLFRKEFSAAFLCGSRDYVSRFTPVMKHVCDTGGRAKVKFEVMAGLNHQLAEERDGKTGPMTAEAVKKVADAADWIRGL